jgi:S-DNA-T family DNA segregation ATPase FtsK/SpoIIIE
VEVVGWRCGPAVTQYALRPSSGVPVSRIVSRLPDLEVLLGVAPLRLEVPIPGQAAVGLEVPNKTATLVTIREGITSPAFAAARLPIVLGNDIAGNPVVIDLVKMPHLLIAGATGQGKSVCLNTSLCSLLWAHTPDTLRLVLIDPKRVELSGYAGVPHLLVPVIVEPTEAEAALAWTVGEVERRYRLLSHEGVRDLAGYNTRPVERLPYVVVAIDEYADLMMTVPGVMDLVCRIAQKARAVGVHLVIATQRPSTDVITGLVKANVPSRIAFAVGSQVDSRVILDVGGAEKLLGRGDMLALPVGASKPVRLQGALTTDRESESIVWHWREQGEPAYRNEVLEGAPDLPAPRVDRTLDSLFARAAQAVAAEGGASVSLVQRKFTVGYARAGRIVDQLAEHGVVGAAQGSRTRAVLMDASGVAALIARLGLREVA